MSDVVLTRFETGGDSPDVILTLAEEDIRSTSLRVTFLTPLDKGVSAKKITLEAVNFVDQTQHFCVPVRELEGLLIFIFFMF